MTDPSHVLQPGMGMPPVRIALLSGVPGLAGFASAWSDRLDAPLGTVDGRDLGLDELVPAEEAADRRQDRADLVVLPQADGRGGEKRQRGRLPRGMSTAGGHARSVRAGGCAEGLPGQDSNLDWLDQNQLCCHYTTG